MESAEYGSDIDVERAMQAKDRAEKRLSQAAQQVEDFNKKRAEVALQRAIMRLKVAKRL